MARKSNKQIAGESALANLTCIHEIAVADKSLAAYSRNATDCARWCRAVADAGMPWPQWMVDGNLKYFATLWRISLWNAKGELVI